MLKKQKAAVLKGRDRIGELQVSTKTEKDVIGEAMRSFQGRQERWTVKKSVKESMG